MTDSVQPRKYWSDLKNKLKDEGSELSEKIGQLKIIAKLGKGANVNTEIIVKICKTLNISDIIKPKNKLYKE